MTAHLRAAHRYASLGWYAFPVHAAIFDAEGNCTGCTCEEYRRSSMCLQNHPHRYLRDGEKCEHPGKCPACKWREKSTIDPATIDRWWQYAWRGRDVDTGLPIRWTPNIGIDCDRSGLLVLDADTYKKFAGDIEDFISVDDRMTVTGISGNGGEHLFYDRGGKPYGNAEGSLPEWFDVRGIGGYIIVPPSLHMSGRRYQYRPGYSPLDIQPLPLPEAVDEILRNATRQHDGKPIESLPENVKRSVRAVERLFAHTDITHTEEMAWGPEGVRWILPNCPFNPEDDPHGEDGSAYVVIKADGTIGAGCHHNRCSRRIAESGLSGWAFLCHLMGYERPRRLQVTVEVTW